MGVDVVDVRKMFSQELYRNATSTGVLPFSLIT
jgi:hypothetical protein